MKLLYVNRVEASQDRNLARRDYRYYPFRGYSACMFNIPTQKATNVERPHTGLYAQSVFVRLFTLPLSGLLFLIAGTAIAMSASATPNDSDRKTIEYLIEYIRESNMIFVRNFSKHTSVEAASHILEKYEHFRNDIETAEDFIDLCATESLMTGRDYLVIDQQGDKLRSHDWLMDVLTDYRDQQRRTTGQ